MYEYTDIKDFAKNYLLKNGAFELDMQLQDLNELFCALYGEEGMVRDKVCGVYDQFRICSLEFKALRDRVSRLVEGDRPKKEIKKI